MAQAQQEQEVMIDGTFDPEWPDVRRVPLGNGRWAVVDAHVFDYVMQFRWYYQRNSQSTTGYAMTVDGPDGRRNLMHRVIANASSEYDVDHRNHDGLDNRVSNLRTVTASLNKQNGRKHRDNRSGFKGVDYRPFARGINPYRARIKTSLDQPQTHLGYFPTAEEAALAYDKAALAYHGNYACLNFPLEPVVPGPRTSHVPDVEREYIRAEYQSPHKGISWHKDSQKWRVRKFHDGKQRYIGVYATESEAVAALRDWIEGFEQVEEVAA